jgi:hypothetical protein
MTELATDLRHRLREAGFCPLPCAGKRPTFEEWQKRTDPSPGDIDLWATMFPHAHNTGILTRLTPALDIDILNPDAAEAVEQLARARLEESGCVLVRIGRAPKRAILMRTDQPFRKISATLIAPNGEGDQKIELLCDGQQLVAFGMHPDTNRPYIWHGGEPGKIAWAHLPYMCEAEARALVEDAAALLVAEHGYTWPQTKARASANNGFDHDARAGSADWDTLVAAIIGGQSYHASLVALAAKLVGSDVFDGSIVRLLRGLMHASAGPRDQRWEARFNDVPRIVGSARKKFGNANDASSSGTSANTGGKPLLWPYEGQPFEKIPRRRWLHAGHYCRGIVGLTIAPGGYGKTSLLITNAIEMTTGRGLIGPAPAEGPLRVAFWNAEDDDDETERRIAAACLRHNIDPADLRGRLFLGSRLAGKRRIASIDRKGNVSFDTAMLAEIERLTVEIGLDVLMFDPLIAFHRLPEADNTAMEMLIKDSFGELAVRTNCCVELAQHTRKASPGQHGAFTSDDSRGAGAIVNASRSARILNRMTAEEAEVPKIAPEDRRYYLRVSRDKSNLAPAGKATWVHLVDIELPNGTPTGDHVQAVEAFEYPSPLATVTVEDMHWIRETARRGNYRRDPRSPEWIGRPLADRLGLDDEGDRVALKAILKTWFANKVLATEVRQDASRHPKEFVVPGDWNDDPRDT